MNYELRMTNGDVYYVDEECYTVVKRYMDGSGAQKSVAASRDAKAEKATGDAATCHVLLDHVVAVVEAP